jgi:hypothetical protein
MHQHPRRPVTALLVGAVLLTCLAACTGHGSASAPTVRPSRTVQAGPPSAPMRTLVTHVAGRLPAAGRRQLAAAVGQTISTYLDQAFLGGAYPRSDFDGSFGAFTTGAAASARRDEALLTNRPLGPTTDRVRAARRTAYLSVLAPGSKVAGVSAALDVLLDVHRGRRAGHRLHLRGHLLLTRRANGSWAIFGYDLNRSDQPAGSAS